MKIATFQNLFLLLLAVFAFAIVSTANAAEVTMDVTVEPPNAYENGEPLISGDIATFNFYYTFDKNPLDLTKYKPILSADSVGNIYKFKLKLAPRKEPYVVNLFAQTVDIFGATSDMSKPVTKIFTIQNTSKPKPIIDMDFNIKCSPDCKVTIL